jgi:mannose/fructose/N-acetylgalactosamine-specific phosphotransferase system component IIC
MKQLFATIVALFVGFFVLVSSLFFAIGLSIVGFIMSKTQSKKMSTKEEREARIIEGEYSDVTNY